jgi:hypothetical protein
MVDRSRVLNSYFPCHLRKLPSHPGRVN